MIQQTSVRAQEINIILVDLGSILVASFRKRLPRSIN